MLSDVSQMHFASPPTVTYQYYYYYRVQAHGKGFCSSVGRALVYRSPEVVGSIPSRRPWSCIFCNLSRLSLKMYIFLTLHHFHLLTTSVNIRSIICWYDIHVDFFIILQPRMTASEDQAMDGKYRSFFDKVAGQVRKLFILRG